MTSSQRKDLNKIIIAAVLLFVGILLNAFLPDFHSGLADIGKDTLVKVIFIITYLLIGIEILLSAIRNICHGQVFDENFLMSVASVGAMVAGEFSEGIAVLLFYSVGELFESYAVGKSRKSIASLMDIRPDYATKLVDGAEIEVTPEEVFVGDIIIVKPGEKVPLDGVIIQGATTLDTMALTGESMPRDVAEGENITSGCINITNVILIKTTKEFGESTVSKILDLVENAGSKKAEVEKFITKFSRYYTPAVVGTAVVLAILPPLVVPGATFAVWGYRALIFLVVSCPCALVISIPLSFFGGVGGASKRGVLVKGSSFLEALAHTETVVFDKTGTLTKGQFKVEMIKCDKGWLERADELGWLKRMMRADSPENMLLTAAAYAECYSSHPISESIKKEYRERFNTDIEAECISNASEQSGQGVSILLDGHRIQAGNVNLLKQLGIEKYSEDKTLTTVYIVIDGVFAGMISLADAVKEDSKAAIAALKRLGVKNTVMLTGDKAVVGKKVGQQLGIDNVYTDLMPADKVEKLEHLLKSKSPSGKLVFVGDGINDAPVLARADIGIAMGGLGSDAAIEAADLVIMTDEPSKIAVVIGIARKTLTIAKENIALALGVKAIVLILAAMGFASMWAAVFADVGVAMIAILNAIRALKVKQE